MADTMESHSQRSSRSGDTTPTPTSLDLVFPSLPTRPSEKIRRWAEHTSDSTGISAKGSPPLFTKSSLKTFKSVSETMSARSEALSDENSLAGSTYEFIDTDEESRDGNATESIASTDFGRPDEVASIDDTERSGEESAEEDDDGSSSLQDVAHATDLPPAVSPKVRSSTIKLEDLDRPAVQSIEFEEPFTLGAETISVKHTVADYDAEQTATVLKNMALQYPPKRLAVTIRQTMTKQGLSTRDPLRILYVGSHAAKQDIIHKIASSVTASVDGGNRAKNPRQFPSQLYNVVPVSAFGSEKTPEIELMHSSGFQIKVEDCISARSLKYEDSPEKPDLLTLTLDDNFSCHSASEGQGFIIEPPWELPHVAIFYCSDNDDSDARRTMSAARKFMGRHGVPSIVISHKQLFDRGQCMSLDQHAIHMCLESRDPNGRGSIIHRRLPIDLASFLNIDARQMNRNLAYITGLHEPLEAPTPSASLAESQDLEKTPYNLSSSFSFIRPQAGAEWRAFVPVCLFLLSVLATVLVGMSQNYSYSTPAISINSKVMSAGPISPTPTSTLQVMSIESITTSIAVKTATRTITITESRSPVPNSLAVLPSKELGNVPPEINNSGKPVNKSQVCSAQILGDREILIRIPSATKLIWLHKEAISVNITRDNITVDTERAYSSDEGIVLLIPKNQAYGVLNISIITTKKPRVNETFVVDFGSTLAQTWQSVVDKISSLFDEEILIPDLPSYEDMWSLANKVLGDVQEHSVTAMERIEEARKIAMKHTATTSSALARFAKGLSLEAVKQSAIISKEITIQCAEMEAKLAEKIRAMEAWQNPMKTVEQWREPLEEGLLKAQVQSKLLWLKLMGDDLEYQRYQRRASEAAELRALMKVMQKSHDMEMARRAAGRAAIEKKVGDRNRVGRVGKRTLS
jgi:hypothetical protein